MLATMSNELSQQFYDMKSLDMIVGLGDLFVGQGEHERFLAARAHYMTLKKEDDILPLQGSYNLVHRDSIRPLLLAGGRISPGRPSFRRIPRPPPDATLLSITRQFCNKGVMNIKEVVTEETLAGLGFEFVQDELRHQPDLLRDIPGGHQPDQLKDIPEEGLDCGPFVELQDSGEEMDSDLLLSRFTAGRKRKRETKGQGKRSSSHHEEGPYREPVVIVAEDQEDATQEPGTMVGQSPPHPVMQGGDLAGSSQGIALERPPSPPAVTYEVATGGRSTRLCIPPLLQSLGDAQLETLITLPTEDQARISAGSEDDLDNMVLLRLSQATLGMIEVVGRKRGRQAAADEVMKAAEAKQKELQE
ncbi:unnamed protein product [Cuscuta campestris]|uniref:Uncharacterized protein n=1 Tax=Cuscuta campestris TaxID=132261 RepID=A0A484MJN4_9ASTE|nr:unnamed protein product [Cuscuta campestris]